MILRFTHSNSSIRVQLTARFRSVIFYLLNLHIAKFANF